MSQRASASGLQSSLSQDGGHESLPPELAQKLPPIIDTSRLGPRRPIEFTSGLAQSTAGSISSPRAQSSDLHSSNAEPKSSHPIGMQNILNPPGADTQSKRRSIAQLDSSPVTITSTMRYPAMSATQSPIVRGLVSTTPPSMTSHPSIHSQEFRRILSPLNRSGSLGVNLPSATIDAKRSPFISSRGDAYMPNDSELAIPSRPAQSTPPVPVRPLYGLPIPPEPTPPSHRLGGQLSQGTRSQSDSPSTSYSSYSQLSHTSPASQYNLLASQPPPSAYYPPSATTPGGNSRQPQITLGSESSYGPVTSSLGQSTYQLMTLDTDQGPIQVPVDVQAASKMADEKRKRNAGASARFRQRRKEKEREASQTIAKLEHQILEIREEREYYRQERDYFRDLAYTSPSKTQATPRAPSPRLRNIAQMSGNLAVTAAQWQGPEERGGHGGRNIRRRTNAYTPAYELPPPVLARPTQSPSYASSPSFPFPNPESGRPHMPLPPRTGPYDPSAPTSYDRSWIGGQ
ncbi:hypothetical protein MMC24_006823 [Lignoscripta atroalba]|nr:hypothetical protein [Lignoscripta atroalba]